MCVVSFSNFFICFIESNCRRASSSSPSLDNSAQSTEERARGRDREMRLRKKERERGRVGFWDVVGGDSPAMTGTFWVQGGDEREGERERSG
jgi:hypothetical protein